MQNVTIIVFPINHSPLHSSAVMNVLNVEYDCYSSSVNNLIHYQVDQSFNLDRKLDLLDIVLDCPEAKSTTAFLCICGMHVMLDLAGDPAVVLRLWAVGLEDTDAVYMYPRQPVLVE